MRRRNIERYVLVEQRQKNCIGRRTNTLRRGRITIRFEYRPRAGEHREAGPKNSLARRRGVAETRADMFEAEGIHLFVTARDSEEINLGQV